jgi:phosphotransacetylase
MNAADKFSSVFEQCHPLPPVRLGVVNAGHSTVMEAVRAASAMGLCQPVLIGASSSIRTIVKSMKLTVSADQIVNVKDDAEAARTGVRLVRDGKVDVLMKGHVHTDVFMRALLDTEQGLRLSDRRVSHTFVCDIPKYSKLLQVTDAAINIEPDLIAKSQILQNAIYLSHILRIERPLVAVLSAVETVNPAIRSTIDAAALTAMASRGQIAGAVIDGPLAFDNAISLRAAQEKSIDSAVAGHSDILLVPDLVSGNILAKNLEYMADAVLAGIVLGLSAPVVLNSRSDELPSRLASLALASLAHHRSAAHAATTRCLDGASIDCAPQLEPSCTPPPHQTALTAKLKSSTEAST